MEQYTVNRYVLKLSWLFLFIWVVSAGMITVFLAMGSPLWIFMFSSVIFLYFWIFIASTYPKAVLLGDDSIVFQLPGSDKIKTYKHNELDLSVKKGYYELAVSGTKRRKKFFISKKDIPAELEERIQKSLFNRL